MANITKRIGKDGTESYLIRVYNGEDVNGKQLYETTTFKPTATTKKGIEKQVFEAANAFEKLVKEDGIISPERTTFAEMVEIWKKNWLPSKTLSVQETYSSVIRTRIIPKIGNMKLSKIRPVHIDNIINEEKAEGLSAATVRYTFSCINSVFRYAVRKQYLKENPCSRCDQLPTVKMRTGKELNFFTKEQAKTFLKALTLQYTTTYKGHTRTIASTGEQYEVPAYTEEHGIPFQWQVYFNLAILGGFRRGELCALTWEDIDDDKKIIDISKALSKTKKQGQIVKGPKTEAGIRAITMPGICFDLLNQWKTEQKALAVKLGSAWKGFRGKEFNRNSIFIKLDNGLPISVDTPSHKFAEVIESYNRTCKKEEDKLPRIRLHDLRHTSATLLLASGVDIETVSHRLGHSKASVTLDIYGHALPSADEEASSKLGEMFG